MPNSNNASDKNMLGDFLTTVFRFALKMFLWAAWALFRATELVCGGLANWIKSTLNQ